LLLKFTLKQNSRILLNLSIVMNFVSWTLGSLIFYIF
jgi:hypothetical protein